MKKNKYGTGREMDLIGRKLKKQKNTIKPKKPNKTQ
jgi:hypothetical protein